MNSIKRSFLITLAISIVPTAQSFAADWTPKAGSQLTFSARIGEKLVGTLVFDFSQANDRIIERRVDHLEVTRLLLKAVLDKTSVITWHGQSLETYTATTTLKSSVKDSDATIKVSRQTNGKLLVVGQDSTHELAADAWPLSLWNRSFISHPQLFDLTYGQVITLSSVSKGMESVTADGVTQNCERFDTKASQDGKTADAIVWFDTSGRLCAMQFPTAMGTVDYARLSAK